MVYSTLAEVVTPSFLTVAGLAQSWRAASSITRHFLASIAATAYVVVTPNGVQTVVRLY